MIDVFSSGKAMESLRGGTLLKSLPITTLGAIGVLGLELMFSFLLSSEEEKDKASGEGFLEAEEV